MEQESAVDIGLSVKWCICNVGAQAPGETGAYFTWEQAQRIRSEHLFLPTKKHFVDLINKCKWEWTKEYGRGGYKITGPNGNSIFLPACDQTCGSIPAIGSTYGYYWSSNDNDSATAWGLGFVDPSWHVEPGVRDYNKINGKSVRMVICKQTENRAKNIIVPMDITERINKIAAYMRRTPEYKDYYVKVYSGGYPTDYGFQSRYTIAVNYNNSDNSRSLNEYVCYLTDTNDNIANVAIYGADIRNIYRQIKEHGKLWGIEVSDCDWETDFIDVYLDLSDCWQDELPNPKDYHVANLYTFELEVNESELRGCTVNEGVMKYQWKIYCTVHDLKIELNKINDDEFTYPPKGIEVKPKEYTYYKKNNYPLDRIHAWCMSGEAAHEYMRHWIPSPGFSSDAPKEEVVFSDELGEYTPRAGFYKLIRRESNQNTSREDCHKYDFLICYYTRSRDLEFVEEEVKIYEGQLYNELSSHGPKNLRLQIGQILHVRRAILDQYLYDGEVRKVYSIDWDILYEKRLPAIYYGAVSHASNADDPGIKAILSKLYIRAIQMPWIDETGKFDVNSSKHAIGFAGYKSNGDLIIPQEELERQFFKGDLIIPQEELEKQIFTYNEGQLETLRQFLSKITYIDKEIKEIIDDLCNKSPIIAPYIVNRPFSTRFSVSPPKYYKSEKRSDYYVHYFNIFDYSTSSDRGAYAELIIEGVLEEEFFIRYRKSCANDYLTGIFII